VLDAVELLGYQRNDVASNLRRADRGSASIGLIVEDVANPFFSAVHRGVEDIARAHDVVVLAGSSDEDPQQERRLAAFTARRVDGLIVVPAGDDHSYLLRERAAGMPLIFLDRPPRFLDADSVLTDNAGGAVTPSSTCSPPAIDGSRSSVAASRSTQLSSDGVATSTPFKTTASR
jgi:LacI family transcriptional regulator